MIFIFNPQKVTKSGLHIPMRGDDWREISLRPFVVPLYGLMTDLCLFCIVPL